MKNHITNKSNIKYPVVLSGIAILIGGIVSIYSECNHKNAVSYLAQPKCNSSNVGSSCTRYVYYVMDNAELKLFNKECDDYGQNYWYDCRDKGNWDTSQTPKKWTNSPAYSNIIMRVYDQSEGADHKHKQAVCTNYFGDYYCNFCNHYSKEEYLSGSYNEKVAIPCDGTLP